MIVNIVSNSKAQILNMGKWYYIYIPLSEEAKELLKPDTINPCWRIEIKKEVNNGHK